MANTVKIRNSSTAAAAPSSLQAGELAINTADGTLFWEDSSGSIQTTYLLPSFDDLSSTAHASTHATGGSDALTPADIGAAPTASPTFTGAATFSNTGNVVPLTITNTGNQNCFVVNDVDGDTSPFVIGSGGACGMGTSSPSTRLEVVGVITVSAGTAAAPALVATGDANTGVYFPTGGDRFAISTGGVERLRVNHVGYVGINNISPVSTLDVNGVITVSAGSAAAPAIVSGTGTADSGIYWPAADTFAISTAGTERLRVRADGNIGVGFSGRSYDRLAIGGATAANANPRGISIEHVLQGVSTGASSSFISSPSTDVAAWGIYHYNISDTTGTGTISSQFGFNVNDLQKGNTNHGVRVRVNDAVGKSNYCIYADGTAPNYFVGQIQTAPGTAAAPAICWYGETSTGIYRPSTDTFAISTAGTERLRVDSSGKVGIGTASPTAALDINSDTIRLRTAKTPASASDTGNAGDICWDASYLYVCTATDTWRRIAHSTW